MKRTLVQFFIGVVVFLTGIAIAMPGLEIIDTASGIPAFVLGIAIMFGSSYILLSGIFIAAEAWSKDPESDFSTES